MPSAITLGIPNLLACRPFVEGLRGSELCALVRDEPAVLAHRLETRAITAAFISPIEYARNASEYLIVPDSAVISPAGNGSLIIYFRSGIHNVSTLAVPPTSASDIVLAKILLAERFDVQPRLVPVAGDLDAMLEKADAALLAGDAALAAIRTEPLDLIEEWIAATDLPYVHGFVAGREDALAKDTCAEIAGAASRGLAAIGADREEEASGLFEYAFTEEAQEGVREFLRFAYYHGILPDVPDLRFY
jgi:chorismate dehydratase